MKHIFPAFFICLIWCASAFILTSPKSFKSTNEGKELYSPDEFYAMQRAYPSMDLAASQAVYLNVLRDLQNYTNKTTSTAGFDSNWRLEGPENTGARFNSIAIHPTNPNIMYAGACLGGVFKTINGGQTWTPIFDAQAYLSVGNIAIDPSNPNTIYVGTGDSNINGYVYNGDGLYKSTDAGQTWTYIGLAAQKIISKIIVHPTNSNIMYVGTMGNPFLGGGDRGLYKTINGGASWTKVLFTSDSSGVIDAVMDPQNPNILYAATYDRFRTSFNSITSGVNSLIWKSTDAGQNWTPINNGIDLPCGRIGLAISQQNPQILYTMIASGDNTGTSVSDFRNVYKTTNGGSSWTLLPNAYVNQGGFAWYFGQIRVNPANDNEVWLLGVDISYSIDGGQSWQEGDNLGQLHADKHDLQYASNGNAILATDGGLYKFDNQSGNWEDIENIPANQIYRVGINPHQVGTYYVGVQDNGTNQGSYQDPNNWQKYFGGDGFQMRFEALTPNNWYAMYQNLGLVYSPNGGQSFVNHTDGIDFDEPANWDAPFILSYGHDNIQYTATQRVYKNTSGGGGLWSSISPKLTDANVIPTFERFHTISCVAESRANLQHLWAGTTDANVWVTIDAALSWTSVNGNGLPDFYITSIAPSYTDEETAIVTQSGYRANDNSPHIHKTNNLGQTWIAIAGDLPNIGINDVCIYETNEDIMFVATDGGVYGTLNGGANWERVGANMPIVPVYDVEIDVHTNRLIAGTFARSLYSVSMDSLLMSVRNTPKITAIPLQIYPNPASDFLKISLPSLYVKEACMHIYDLKGSTIYEGVYENEIALSNWKSGIYFINIENKNRRWTAKFVKE